MTNQIALTHDQAQAVAERAARIRKQAKQSRGNGLTGIERMVLTYDSPYNDPEARGGIYLCIEGRQQVTPMPLFAKDLGRERNFEASRLPPRDGNGHLWHPDMDGIGFDEFDMGPQLRAIGWHTGTTCFENDADQAMRERYYEAGEPDCSDWTPTPPRGDGWLMAAIYDTEDGPVALFVRKAEGTTVSIERYAELGAMFHDNVVTMQAAWIEWRRGQGAEAAMQWIENTLRGPGLIPKEDEPWAAEAQAYHDANRTEKFPQCFCGRPSNISARGKGFCCQEHDAQDEGAGRATAGSASP